MRNLVVLGGGYGGLTIVNELLEKEWPSDIEVTLIDRMPYQGLKTEYYALASGTVSDVDIRVEFPTDPRITKTYGEVSEVDLNKKLVYLQGQDPISYDWLVVALGCVDKFHGIPGAQEFAHGIQTLSQTRMTYTRVNDVMPYGQVTIVGGGLSGVEMAAELREGRPDLNIRILDRGASILSSFPEKLQVFVREWFIKHDVEMMSHVSLSRVEPGILHNQNELIYTDETIWTAGIQPSPVVQKLDVPKDMTGRVLLNEYHQVPLHPEVYVVGDCASLTFSPSAQAAEAQGKQVVEVLRALWKDETPHLGTIKLKGVLGSLGKKSGFGLMGKKTVMLGKVPRALKSGVLWMSKRHFG
ncbi:FAD-dependent oxidoreductase [Paenibacillus aurantius]|uniref:FAD-dependent oxidoreductase n=1 Tax=Paenibacillus aurantius TaxID=2918900 RepID=A0AA96LJH9_9BACL|nr:FAD-dependent oxidoreductase [Paenibacillus aurantius]WNQ12632.1 FAD-dependent oxidoreductase [Paenibacillus aurantius]